MGFERHLGLQSRDKCSFGFLAPAIAVKLVCCISENNTTCTLRRNCAFSSTCLQGVQNVNFWTAHTTRTEQSLLFQRSIEICIIPPLLIKLSKRLSPEGMVSILLHSIPYMLFGSPLLMHIQPEGSADGLMMKSGLL